MWNCLIKTLLRIPQLARNQKPPRRPRVAVVGTGFVGSTTAYALLMSGTPAEIVLIDRDRRRAEGHAHDLRDAEACTCSGRILVGDFCDCCSSDVTIITTGVSQAGLKSRLDGLAAGVVFLASPEASYVTGTLLNIDGGLLA